MPAVEQRRAPVSPALLSLFESIAVAPQLERVLLVEARFISLSLNSEGLCGRLRGRQVGQPREEHRAEAHLRHEAV